MQALSRTQIEPAPSIPADGKRRLIEAALRLAARGTGLSALGLREMAREAGLNHNTFYRHFDGLEDLGRAAATEIASQLMAGMKTVRIEAARHADATVGTVDYFLDTVLARPDVFVVGARELHTIGSPLRPVFQQTLDAIAWESVEQILTLDLVPLRDRNRLFRVSLDITHFMLCRALDLIDAPETRPLIQKEMVAYIRRQFIGAISLSAG